MPRIKAPHERLFAADNSDGHPASHGFTVNHHVGRYTEIFLSSAGGEAKPGINFVENQWYVALAEYLPWRAEPFGITFGGILGLARIAGQQHRVVRWRRIGMERLHWIHQHRRNFLFPPANHAERCGIYVLQCQTIVEWPLAPESALHAVPPAVISAGETDNELSPGIEARHPHGSHHRFGSAHVKRNFVHMRDFFEDRNVVGNHRMKRTQHRPEILYAFPAFVNPLFIAIEACDIDAIRAAHVDRPVTVEILQL